MKLLKKLSVVLLTLILGLVIVSYSIYRNNSNDYFDKKYNIQLGTHSFTIFETDTSTQLLKISPYDDFAYTKETKDHLIDSNNFESSSDKTNLLYRLLNGKIFSKKKVAWGMISKTGLEVKYEVEKTSDEEIKITREVKNLKPDTEAIGQSFVICPDCWVTDDSNRVFFISEQLTSEKLELAQKLKLSPVILTNNLLPQDTKEVVIIDKNKNPYIKISTDGFLEVNYDEKWRVVEFKTWLQGNKSTVYQTLKLK